MKYNKLSKFVIIKINGIFRRIHNDNNYYKQAYQEMMEEARKIAVGRMVDKAESMGANAIIGMQISTSAVMAGASEVIAYGTAVLIEE